MKHALKTLALPTLLALLHGCGDSLIDGVEIGTFAGEHQSGFEFYGFRQCGHESWGWLEGDVPGSGAAWVRFEGYRVGPGRFGHVGGFEYQYVIREILASSTDSTGNICS